MGHRDSILFVGNFFSKHLGTLNPSETIKNLLSKDSNIEVNSASDKLNKFLRVVDIIYKSIFVKYEIIHIDIFSGPNIYFSFVASFLATIKNRTIVLNLHGSKLIERAKKNSKILKFLLDHAHILITPYSANKKYFESLGYNIVLIPNSLLIEKFDFKPANYQGRILWVRAFHDIYNPILAIRTLSLLINHHREAFHLTMVGPDKGLLKEVLFEANTLGVDEYLTITGPVDNNALVDYFHTHSVFINTTNYESFGMSVLEAAACGIPIVSTKVGELPNIWRGKKNILFCDKNSAEQMAQNILDLKNNIELKNSLVIQARKIAEQYSWEKNENKYKNLLFNNNLK